MKIKITKNGPYIVSGGIPLSEKIITPKGSGYVYEDGVKLPQNENYSLCRCGASKNAPFCDSSHEEKDFIGKETASRKTYEQRASISECKTLDLLDDGRCSYARFCHREAGSVWELTESSSDPVSRNEAIIAASECPAGRLLARDKDGTEHEIEFEKAIEILQDPECKASCGIFVKGGIPIESADGETYELRNRVMLCRCGSSDNKPFCDATHVDIMYVDGL
ncbi:MAG: CDGSH iron-sulfur domain-containing protein [Bacillota bacterium]